ncbi:TRAP transporter substrate-binding protein DctP [Deferribacterales bacterium Es71-Z0220]|uniref:TRAP transporter substrate-binding protein n=1 Tax=Deferrivibrio essentukiensis TaxID=2880922 RepID=UPI001F609736|nr:TRAP transporter substrate-binding protein DctP [Deferrivibrio essentukiensis]MCB4204236.1 TRAP transporter substrate-binding protein DctP [Deferrivibrio essentukiensis]
MKRFLTLLMAVALCVFMTTSAFAAKTYNWKMVTTWSTGIPWHQTVLHFADTVKKMTNGEMEIKVFPAGSIVPAFQVFDAVRNGVAEMGHDWPGYWKGKDEAFVAFASVPFGLNNIEYTIWLMNAGGMQLAEEIYGKYGLVPLLGGNSGQEMGFFTKKPLTKVEDLKGMKVRTVGWAADILKDMGVSVSPLPGGEIYLAFERGVLDSAEFSVPFITYPMGFQEIAKNVMVPGWHQPGVQLMFTVNKKAWDSLPEHLKTALKVASYETQLWDIARSEAGNAEAIKKYKQEGVTFNKLDDNSLNELRKTTKKYLDGLRAKNPNLDKVLGSQDEFVKNYSEWKDLRSGVSAYPYEDYIKGKHYE